MKKQINAWVRFAQRDLSAVYEIIEKPDLTGVAAFLCQQAIEKFFKALILNYEKPIARTHNLLTLYGTIKEVTNLELNEDFLVLINDIYLESRYPCDTRLSDDWLMPTVEQVKDFFSFANMVEKKVMEALKRT
ncbi:MAG: HEPN domain-containing protein [Chitinispirillales bacterium]|jgi:HEPN domain-containing protein|nr:HEPN domain-containing protein [Chitinispirillales bacterium]